MNWALPRLILWQSRGFVRRTLRGATSPRRALFLLLGIVVIVLWLGPIVFTSVSVRHGHHRRMQTSPQRFRDVAPLALLGICAVTIVSSAGDKAIAFSPGEVDMLFPGPFTRRQLLAYKLLKSTLAALLTAIFLSLMLLPYARSLVACYLGVFLTLLFIQLFSTAGVLLGQAISQRAYTLVRRLVLLTVLVIALLLARTWISSHASADAFYEFRYSDAGRKVLAPFEAFGAAITARNRAELGPAAGQAAAIDLTLLLLVMLLDANYIEAAISASRRRYAQLQRIRGGSILAAGVKGNVKWKLPRPPWIGGAGPIAWRQATSAARSAKGLLLLLLILALAIGPIFAAAAQSTDISQPLIGAVAWLTVLLSGLLKFDFRGDLDHMDELKTLPIRSTALAAGQLAVPTFILTGTHVLLLLSVASMIESHRGMFLVAACLALPFNTLLMASENLIFLLFPTRPAAASPGDFQVLGRQAAQLVMKALAVLFGCVIAFAIAAPVFILTGGSLLVLTLLAGTILAIQGLALVPAIAWAYNRFDPAVDTPA